MNYSVKFFGGPAHGVVYLLDHNVTWWDVAEFPKLWPRKPKGPKDIGLPSITVVKYKIERFFFAYGRVGWRECRVAIAPGYELTGVDLLDVRDELLRVRIRYYDHSFLEDFDAWFNAKCHEITGKTFDNGDRLDYVYL